MSSLFSVKVKEQEVSSSVLPEHHVSEIHLLVLY